MKSEFLRLICKIGQNSLTYTFAENYKLIKAQKSRKKGIELSITTLVVIIISIIILIYSIYLIYNIMTQASIIEKDIEQRSQKEIELVMKDPREIISIPFAERNGKIKAQNTFLIGIRNLFESTSDFSAIISFDTATDKSGRVIDIDKDFIEKEWLGNYRLLNTQKIESLDYKQLKLIIKPSDRVSNKKNTPNGDYVFNICVFNGLQPPVDACVNENKTLFYNNEINKVVISVS